jgi:hypothetical protein
VPKIEAIHAATAIEGIDSRVSMSMHPESIGTH